MKILHLCDSLNPAGLGGYESIIHYLSKAMVSEGHESFVVTQPPYRNSPESIQKQNYIIYHLTGNRGKKLLRSYSSPLTSLRMWIYSLTSLSSSFMSLNLT
ncbi:MAG: hypothetical protein ACXACG_17155 [Candidatus Thorarchaeota archaeon]